MKDKKRKEKLSIYLAKDSSQKDEEILKVEDSKEPLYLSVEGCEVILYVKKIMINHLLHGQNYSQILLIFL